MKAARVRLRLFVRKLLHLGDSPERTARAFALGVFLGFSPLIGLHTILGLILSFVLKLNRVAVLLGVYVNNPWTLAPMASLGTALGFVILGSESQPARIGFDSMLSSEFWRQMFSDVEHLLLPFLVGNSAISSVAALLSYLIVRRILVRHRERRKRASQPV